MKILINSILFVFLGLNTQGQSILGTWQIDADKTLESIDKKIIDSFEVEGGNLEEFKQILASVKYAFYPNQQMALETKSLNDKIVIQKLKWEFYDDKSQIIILKDNYLTGDTVDILALEKEKMILYSHKQLGGAKLFLYRSNVEIDTNQVSVPMVSKEVLADIIKSIPTSIDITFLLQDLDISYDKSLLADIKNSNISDFQNAWSYGVYSSNLSYIEMYQQKQEGFKYLEVIKTKADNLEIGDFFDFQTIKKLMTGNSFDSLMMVTAMNLENVNERLQKKDRADLTTVILTGSWLESLYLCCKIAQQKPKTLLYNRIGEQGIVLDQLLLLLSFYEDTSADIRSLMKDLERLKQVYDKNVKIEYTYDNEESEITTAQITFTEKDLKLILQITSKIRGKILQ